MSNTTLRAAVTFGVTFLIFVILGPNSHAQSFTTFNVPGAAATAAFAISPAGEVAGTYSLYANGVLHSHGFLRKADGRIVSFDPPGSTDTLVTTINLAGEIVGSYKDTNLRDHGYVRRGNGAILVIDVPGSISTTASDMNPAGQLVGAYFDTSNVGHTFLRDTDGTITVFPDTFYAAEIDPSGQILGACGYHACLRKINGTFIVVDPPDSYAVRLVGMNPAGQIVGAYLSITGTGWQGFLREKNGAFTIFDAGYRPFALAINANGEVAGWYYDASDDDIAHSFLRKRDGTIVAIEPPGAYEADVWGINARGMVVGNYCGVSVGCPAFIWRRQAQ